MKRTRGFTLVELLVVVSVIALLIAILLPALGTAKEQARRTVCGSSVRQFGIAALNYDHDYKHLPPNNGNFAVIMAAAAMRDAYGVPAQLIECPSLARGLLNFNGIIRAPWRTAAVGNTSLAGASKGNIGYMWLASYAFNGRYPTEGGWNGGVSFPLLNFGYFALISTIKPVRHFPNSGGGFTVPPLPASKHPIMADCSYTAQNPAMSATNGSDDAPQWGSHAGDELGNAPGGNFMMADLHVAWQPLIRGKSWRVYGPGTANYGYWTPAHAPPVGASISYLP